MSVGRASRILSRPLLGLVWIYRFAISPMLGANCRFQPTCSEYAREALQRHGAFRGSALILRRIGRCHPWGGSGYDPVPEGDTTQKKKNPDGQL
ncbi:MAG: membrane protein insertion efficiency factor YidD [Halioglobus sp.]|nr:membrane protein insertion efficiency factor YidD [Halioglobus sp.]